MMSKGEGLSFRSAESENKLLHRYYVCVIEGSQSIAGNRRLGTAIFKFSGKMLLYARLYLFCSVFGNAKCQTLGQEG